MGTTTTPGGVGLLGSWTVVDAGCCSALGRACLQLQMLPVSHVEKRMRAGERGITVSYVR